MDANVKYRCYNCGKQFKDDAHLERHKNRKTPCLIRDIDEKDRNNPLRCIYCNKIFTKMNNLTRHHGSCKVKNGGLQTLHDKVKYEETLRIMKEEQNMKNMDMADILSKMQARMDVLELQNNELKQNIQPTGCDVICGVVNTVANGNLIVNNTNNINVQLTVNNYNKPNLDYVKNDIVRFSKILNRELSGTPIALVEWVWFNRERPENVSVHLVNKKTGETLVSIEGTWITDNISNVIPILRNIVYELTEHIIEHNRELITFATDMVPAFLARNRNDEKVIKMDEEDILQKLIDGRELSQDAISGKLVKK